MIMEICTKLDSTTEFSFNAVRKLERKGSKGGHVTKYSLMTLLGMPYDDMNNALRILLSDAWMRYLSAKVGQDRLEDLSAYRKALKKKTKLQKRAGGDKAAAEAEAAAAEEAEALKPITAAFYLQMLNEMVEMYKRRFSFRTWMAAVLAFYEIDPETFDHPLWMHDGFPGELTKTGALVPQMSDEVHAIINTFAPASSAAYPGASALLARFGDGESMITKAIRYIVQPQTERGKPAYSWMDPGAATEPLAYTPARLWPDIQIGDYRMSLIAKIDKTTIDDTSFFVPIDMAQVKPVQTLRTLLASKVKREVDRAVNTAFATEATIKRGFVITTDPPFTPSTRAGAVKGSLPNTFGVIQESKHVIDTNKGAQVPEPHDPAWLVEFDAASFDVLRLVAGYLPDEGPYTSAEIASRLKAAVKYAPTAMAHAFLELSPGKGGWDLDECDFYTESNPEDTLFMECALPESACATLLGNSLKIFDELLGRVPAAYKPDWDVGDRKVRVLISPVHRSLCHKFIVHCVIS
jgi:hypothetical protein